MYIRSNMNPEEIKKQIRQNMQKLEDGDDFETSFNYKGETILVSFFLNREFNEYEDYGKEHWILLFENARTHKRKEIWIPLDPDDPEIIIDDLIVGYVQEGYLEELN